MRWATRVAVDLRTVYLDTETTGLGANDEIVDIAVVNFNGRVLPNTLVKPTCQIPACSSEVHGLTDADVAMAPRWDRIANWLYHALSGRTVVVYNLSFDRRLVAQCCKRWSVPEPEADWHCAMRAYAEFAGVRTPGRGYRWHPLDRAVRQFGGKPGGHRALADALACRAVVLGMAARALD